MAARIVTEGPEDSLMDIDPASVRPVYLESDLRWGDRSRGDLLCSALLRIGYRFGGRLAVIELAGYVLSTGPAWGSVATIDVGGSLWAGRIPGW
jgi:hypothetical protein